MTSAGSQHSGSRALTLAALGVVYGDIGTSPLYTLKECFAGPVGLALTPFNILGILSLIFWALMLVVSLKYVSIILRADNKGEGGILALLALAQRETAGRPRLTRCVAILGIFGAALFYGDCIITPAISVLSAVEGISVVSHKLDQMIVPLCIGIIIGLFAVQSHGTATVGKIFGPVMLLWFAILAVMGIASIVHAPEVLAALNPLHAVRFFLAAPGSSFILLGAVVLCLTGGEALYADMGHFGKAAIRNAWYGLVLPALVLNYFGQGALLLQNPQAIKNPFFLLAPGWGLIPLVLLATFATVIASQAVISGAYSMASQAIQLGFTPRMEIRHTSASEKGQIFISQINWALLLAVIILILSFRSSGALASAYGFAVTCTMVITTLLAFLVLGKYSTPLRRLGMFAVLGGLLLVDLAFFAANSLKIADGGWMPLLVGLVLFTMMMTWKRGRMLLMRKLREGEMPLAGFVGTLESSTIARVEGTAVFLTASSDTVPHALLHNLKHNKILHEQVILLTVSTADVPLIPPAQQLTITQLGNQVFQILICCGFKDTPDIPAALALAATREPQLHCEPMQLSYFLSRETIVESRYPEMARWRRMLFSLMMRNAARITSFFGIPPNRVVEMGMQVEL
ncbi:potassium transporter Kup [Chitinilyticum aquatile]|uniref:potassium transporter Kup n=1 Tax=Chitinilyticum aquatile TaxID=362520 RepID=UPI0003F95AE4|nr:potassium transporter Kup [Chitinilyticum aquatile]